MLIEEDLLLKLRKRDVNYGFEIAKKIFIDRIGSIRPGDIGPLTATEGIKSLKEETDAN